jgi:hypothetical protein
MTPTAIKQAPRSNIRWLTAALFVFRAEPSLATPYAGALPCQTLGALQDMLIGPVAHVVITLNLAFSVAGDLNAALESYARYYEHVHGDAVDSKALIPEMLSTFLQADREFRSWSRNSHHRRPGPFSVNGDVKSQG